MFSISAKCFMLLLVALQLFETPVCGQVFALGTCPNVTVATDFNMDDYLGKWYINRSYFAYFQATLDCITVTYTKFGEEINITKEGLHKLTRRTSIVVGAATVFEPGKLGAAFYGNHATTDNYWVLGTDYTNYAVIWSCTQIGLIRGSFAWIFTRVPEPPSDIIDMALAVFAKNGIDTAPLSTVQDHCA